MRKVFLAFFMLAACSRTDDGRWVMVEDHGDAGAFLDRQSVKRDGELRTFNTKYAAIGLGRLFAKGEIRTTYRVDCEASTYRTVGGGIYVRGKLKSPHTVLTSGPLPRVGYLRTLGKLVC